MFLARQLIEFRPFSVSMFAFLKHNIQSISKLGISEQFLTDIQFMLNINDVLLKYQTNTSKALSQPRFKANCFFPAPYC